MTLAARISDFWREVRAAPTAVPQVHYEPVLPESDSSETLDLQDDDEAPKWPIGSISGRSLILHYSDSRHQISQRHVICHRLESKADVLYLAARCLLRDQHRCFRVDRIAVAIDTETGELYEPGLNLLEQFLPDAKTFSPHHYGLSPVQYADFNAALNVLAFMARCDGHWHPAEGEAIEAFAASYWLRAEIATQLDMAEVRRHLARLSPDPEIFWIALTRVAERPVLRALITRHVAAVIDADGEHHAQEIYWGNQIDEFLSMQ